MAASLTRSVSLMVKRVSHRYLTSLSAVKQTRAVTSLCTRSFSTSSCRCSDHDSDSSDDEKSVKKTESKLNLAKPRSRAERQARGERQEVTPPEEESVPGISDALTSAAKDVAESLGGDADKTHQELLDQLLNHAKLTETQRQGQTPTQTDSISSIFSGMTVDRRPKFRRGQREPRSQDGEVTDRRLRFRREEGQGVAQSMLQSRDRKSPHIRGESQNFKLYDGPSLGIFTKEDLAPKGQVSTSTRESLFDVVLREELETMKQIPPANAFEEMARWTNEGKVWKFPIDNEQGWEQEANVGFHEHVFLDHRLTSFPVKGPVRHFMELVVVGLSKNPYLTVQQKHAHIDWFRDYFNSKQAILMESLGTEGAMPAQEQIQS